MSEVDPRTPPALSNVAPRCKHFAATMEGICIACGVDVRGIHVPAAPPVAGGPAATPFGEQLCACGHRRVVHDYHHKKCASCECQIFDIHRAEPPEARAAALLTQLRAELVSIIKDVAEPTIGHARRAIKLTVALDERVADLQRQLDEARRELQEGNALVLGAEAITCRNGKRHSVEHGCLYCRTESAEAANQELRRQLNQLAVERPHPPEGEVTTDEPFYCRLCGAESSTVVIQHDINCPTRAAMLGPQHGDTK
jgi:hypothetical protein